MLAVNKKCKAPQHQSYCTYYVVPGNLQSAVYNRKMDGQIVLGKDGRCAAHKVMQIGAQDQQDGTLMPLPQALSKSQQLKERPSGAQGLLLDQQNDM